MTSNYSSSRRSCNILQFIIIVTSILSASIHGVRAESPDDDQNMASSRALLDRYCVTCHNETLKTANLLLDKANVADVSEDPSLWESVIIKLSLRAMPPVGTSVRPSDNEYEALMGYLKTKLDHQARVNMNPGRPAIHRLNRTEYKNSVRDLLDMEIDAEEFLPPDNVGEGFDNNAEALMISPLLMDRYLLAAGRISRLAVGTVVPEPAVKTYVLDNFVQQDRMSEDLPFGSRGGTAIQHYFPLDGEYTLDATLQSNSVGFIRGLRKEHILDVFLDNKRIARLKIGGEFHGRSGPIFSDPDVRWSGDPDQAGYEFTADKALKIRFPSRAGTHQVGVTFINNSLKQTGMQHPELTLRTIGRYKGGDPDVESITISGPYEAKGPGQTASRRKIFMCYPEPTAKVHDKEICARTILSRLARQAYRRSLTGDDMEYLLSLYRSGQQHEGFDSGIELALQGILAGPEFLFRIERDPVGVVAGEVYPVSDLELASRLSFFLWSTLPDETLLTVAEEGRLREPGVLAGQVRRMMADPRFHEFIHNFGGQWLAVPGVEIAAPDPDIFPEFDDELREAFKQEVYLWFGSMVREDRSVVELLTSDYTYANERLARHYGIPNVNGSRFRRVTVNQPERHGLWGKGGILLKTAYKNRTSPVLRGKWVLENLLSMPPAPPPPNVPSLKTDDEGGKALALKQAMEHHRANPVCAPCHKLMDPIGFALEQFNAIGAFRTRYIDADAEVDASGILFDGNEFSNTREFQGVFQKHSDRVVHTIAEKLLTYAVGRRLQYYDQPVIRDILRRTSSVGHTWSSLIMGVIESEPFQYRRAD